MPVNSPTYQLSKHLVSIILYLVGKSDSLVRNSFEGLLHFRSVPAQWNSVGVIGCVGTVHKCPNGCHIEAVTQTAEYGHLNAELSTLMHCVRHAFYTSCTHFSRILASNPNTKIHQAKPQNRQTQRQEEAAMEVKARLPQHLQRATEVGSEKGAHNWLTALLIAAHSSHRVPESPP